MKFNPDAPAGKMKRRVLVVIAVCIALGAGTVLAAAALDAEKFIQRELQRMENTFQRLFEQDAASLASRPFLLILPSGNTFALSGIVTIISEQNISVDVNGIPFIVDTSRAAGIASGDARRATSTQAFTLGESISIRGTWDPAQKILRADRINFASPPRSNDAIQQLIELLNGQGTSIPPALKPFQ